LLSFIVILIYIILLNKLRSDQISCSGRSATRWQYTRCSSGTRSSKGWETLH